MLTVIYTCTTPHGMEALLVLRIVTFAFFYDLCGLPTHSLLLRRGGALLDNPQEVYSQPRRKIYHKALLGLLKTDPAPYEMMPKYTTVQSQNIEGGGP